MTAVKIEKDQSLTSLYELSAAEKERQLHSKSTAALFEEMKDRLNLPPEELAQFSAELAEEGA